MRLAGIFLMFIFSSCLSYSQADWSSVDFTDEYKGKFKISGGSAKRLKKYPLFVSDYAVSQATLMKGSETSATKGVFSEVSIEGLTQESYQQMVNQLYSELIKELESAGLTIDKGDRVLRSDYVQKRVSKDKDNEVIGSTGNSEPVADKKNVTEGTLPGYGAFAVIRDLTFRPQDKNVCYTTNIIKEGNFDMKVSSKSETNLLSINFMVSFANFDGGRGYKDVKLETEPALAIKADVKLITTNGSFNKVYYKKTVWGGKDWATNLSKVNDNNGAAQWLGLARSAGYVMNADNEKYISELQAILSAFQKDIVRGIKSEL
ncbi:hypothetical protein [Salibacter halophilus]|nr:hypothetical protein [Salibacter halophilus]